MEDLVPQEATNGFRAPASSLGDLSAESAAAVITAAADIALVVDRDGVIRDVACGGDEPSLMTCGSWLGRSWTETVTVESRPKIEEMLKEAASRAPPRWRQVNHPLEGGPDLPVRYSAVRVGDEGRIVALGRELRSMATLQQRLIQAQQSMEREYARLRHVETRYRLLFQISSEAVLIVDSAGQKVVGANPAAIRLLGASEKRILGRVFPDAFDLEGAETVQALFAEVRSLGRGDEVAVRSRADGQRFLLSASLFRQDRASHLLVRLAPQSDGAALPPGRSMLLEVVESAPDGFVVTTPTGRVLTANGAFVDLTQLVTEEQVRGKPLERWLGRSGVDFDVLLSTLREHGSVRLFSTIVRGEYGATEDVEVSAVSVLTAEEPCLGFTIRSVGRRLSVEPPGRVVSRSAEQLTELVGRVSLKELVRESTASIERLCIEAALELTGDNRASAAEMLGLSRQSLYAKLRRYNLGDLGPEEH